MSDNTVGQHVETYYTGDPIGELQPISVSDHAPETCPKCTPRWMRNGEVVPPLPWEHWAHELAREELIEEQHAFNRREAAAFTLRPVNDAWRGGLLSPPVGREELPPTG